MISKELSQPDLLEVYNQSILERFKLAQAIQGGSNCQAAAYYLLGVEPHERNFADTCFIDLNICKIVDNINDAIFVGFTKANQFERNTNNFVRAGHIAVLHPQDKTKVIHRDLVGFYKTRREKHNLKTKLIDLYDQMIVGLNPIRIESLSDVQKRYYYFNMYLLSFKSNYFDKLLSSI